MAKRLSTIRGGILYQDLVAAEAILDMVAGGVDAPLWVRLEDRRGGTFDDVVVGYSERTVWRQVRWAQNPGSEPLTVETLCKKKGRQRSLLAKLFQSFLALRQNEGAIDLELLTNRSPDSELRSLLHGQTSKVKLRLTQRQRARLHDVWQVPLGAGADDFQEFLRTVSFRVNAPGSDERERAIRKQLRHMGCAEESFELLLDAIGRWSCDETKEEIRSTDVEAILGAQLDTPSNEFQLPAIRVDRPEAQDELARRVNLIQRGYVILLGSPGSGKSTLLNTLRDGTAFGQNDDFLVYNCFTGTSDSFLRTRASADNFAKFLARELHLLGRLNGRLLAADSFSIEKLLAHASSSGQNGDRLILVVDGLDYAKRFGPSNAARLFDNLPPNLPDKIVIVVSAQVKEQLPAHLQQLDTSQYLHVSPLDVAAIQALLKSHAVFERTSLKEYEREDICRTVHAITNGHALHVNYIARQLLDAACTGRALSEVIAELPNADGDITRYYRSVFGQPTAALASDAMKLMAASPFELTADEIGSLLRPPVDHRSIRDTLRPFEHLFEQISGRYHFCHDSLRVYADEQIPGNAFPTCDQIAFLSGLENDPRTGDHLLHLLSETRPLDPYTAKIDCDWLAAQIAAGANTSLLHEGIQQLVLAALEAGELVVAAWFWALNSCLERAEQEGDLDEATLGDAWLAMGRSDLIERYIFVSSQFLSRRYPGPSLIDLAEDHREYELAERLRDRLLTQSVPELDASGFMFEFGSYVRQMGRRKSAVVVASLIRERAEAVQLSPCASEFPGVRSASEQLAEFGESIARDCLAAGMIERVEEWLDLEPRVFSNSLWSELYLRVRLSRGDIANRRQHIRTALQYVDSLEVLDDFSKIDGFEHEVGRAVNEFHLSPLFHPDFRWFERRQTFDAAIELFHDMSICCRLSLAERRRQIEESATNIRCRIAREFVLAVIGLAKDLSHSSADWHVAMVRFVGSLPAFTGRGNSHDDVEAAQAFVCGIGSIVWPAVRGAKEAGQTLKLGNLIESKLIPTLRRGYMLYEGGILSIADVLQREQICRKSGLRLLRQVEDIFCEDTSFKSGSLIGMASRYAVAGDQASARRCLFTGVRAAFTYGYRKDTTINEFIVAFELVAPRLKNRFAVVARFITRVLILLDTLTDGRMLYFASSYFVAVICKHDLKLGAQLARILWAKCRSLRPHSILIAARDQGIELDALRKTFIKLAPEVKLDPSREDDDDYDPRQEFVVNDRTFPTSEPELVVALREEVCKYGHGAGLHRLPGVISSLLSSGNSRAAMKVFGVFERSVKELVFPYVLPRLDGVGR